MSAQNQRVVLSFLDKSAMPNLSEGDLTKLMNLNMELMELSKTLKPLLSYQKINKVSDSSQDSVETQNEIDELEHRIREKSEEYTKLMHKIYPKEHPNKFRPKVDY